jgi:hypothetical protein
VSLAFLDAIAHGRNGARAIGAKHIGELRLDAKFPGEAALALERVPFAHAGALDMDQHLIGADLRHWKRLEFDRLKTAETIERDRLHFALRCLDHRSNAARKSVCVRVPIVINLRGVRASCRRPGGLALIRFRLESKYLLRFGSPHAQIQSE